LTFTFNDSGSITATPAPGEQVLVNNEPLQPNQTLRADTDGNPDVVEVGSLRMRLLRRHEKVALRVSDRESERRDSYPAIPTFPADMGMRVQGLFKRHDEGRRLPIRTSFGDEHLLPNVGRVEFSVAGEQCQLEAIRQGRSKELWLIFKDRTSSELTYGAGRFLFVPFEYPNTPEAAVELDFNKAINPPCAFTECAGCPLPPPENLLPIPILAGEKSPTV
jgi:hypothetical protein